ncbi:MAG: hypothetical protein IH614_18470 [Desulfuromonadales bacterium]|nr:hypothetical protein [Desulfuromonadales bacterium]
MSPLLDPEGFPLFSLADINRLPMPAKESIYRQLIPEELFVRFGIDRDNLRGSDGDRKVRFLCPAGLGVLRIEVRLRPTDADCLFFVEIADTPYGQVELSFCLVNDPASPRFNVDRDEAGRDNCFGTLRRNLEAEKQAMAAGLAPHQVRRGMRLFAPFFRHLEQLVAALGVSSIVAEPLSYDNAVRYEGYGFDYLTGKQLMLSIDREFRPGGALWKRLDDSTPFRRRGMEKTVRGRSWAIHDGILEHPWDGVRIYKIPGLNAGINTFSEPRE